MGGKQILKEGMFQRDGSGWSQQPPFLSHCLSGVIRIGAINPIEGCAQGACL